MDNRISLKHIVGGGYTEFWKNQSRYRVVKGSRGSKKSKTTALNLIFRLLKYDKANILCVRRYANTLRDSVYADLKWAIARLGVTHLFDYYVSPMLIVRKSTGQKILFRGLDDGLKITSISVDKGALCWVWCEEAYEIAEDDFNKLDMSIRGAVPDGYFKQITLTLNPWSATHWIKKRFFDIEDDNTFTQTTTYRCNEWLDEADKKLFEKMRLNNPKRYKVEGLGDWGIAEGLIFDNHKVVDTLDVQNLLKTCILAIGLDFGYTDPNALVVALVDKTESKIYIIDEYYSRGVTNKVIAQVIKDKGYGSCKIICDSAEPKSIAELQDIGIRAEPTKKGKDSVNYGIQLIQNFEIIVLSKCVNFANEISNYAWEQDKQGNLTGKPEHTYSHGMDALRYAITRLIVPNTFTWE